MKISRITETSFAAMQDEWTSLLDKSEANSLFLSWNWSYQWWQAFKKTSDDSLLLLAAYDNEELIGLAPLHTSLHKGKRGLKSTRCVQFIGTKDQGNSGIRTEYLQFITKKEQSNEIIKNILQHLYQNYFFDELFLNDIIVDSSTFIEINRFFSAMKTYIRPHNNDETYPISCQQSFSQYLQSIGKNTRLKAFNRRKVLEHIGDVSIEYISNEHTEKIFDILDLFYSQRWGQGFPKKNKEFFLKLNRDSTTNLGGIVVSLDGRPIGCTLDITVSDCVYNLQMGFKEHIDKKISTGTLTLGYAIEHYCTNPEINTFDLLAGGGKNSNYKQNLTSPHMQLQSLQIIRSPFYKLIYKMYDRLRS